MVYLEQIPIEEISTVLELRHYSFITYQKSPRISLGQHVKKQDLFGAVEYRLFDCRETRLSRFKIHKIRNNGAKLVLFIIFSVICNIT